MKLATFPGSGGDIEEPDWKLLIPDQERRVPGVRRVERADNAVWRDVAHREWLRIVAELRAMETLSPANRHQIQRLVIAYVRYDRAAARQFEMGPVLPSPKTKTPMVNLWQTEMRQADADATVAEGELGIPPRRAVSRGLRASVSVQHR
jgi:hypothetical protein